MAQNPSTSCGGYSEDFAAPRSKFSRLLPKKILGTARGSAPALILFWKAEYRGVAQLVARLLWEQDAAGSSPVTSTKNADLTAVLQSNRLKINTSPEAVYRSTVLPD